MSCLPVPLKRGKGRKEIEIKANGEYGHADDKIPYPSPTYLRKRLLQEIIYEKCGN